MKVEELTWSQLNEAITQQTEETLGVWLKETIKAGGPKYRAIRIYGRLAIVRRERELREIETQCSAV